LPSGGQGGNTGDYGYSRKLGDTEWKRRRREVFEPLVYRAGDLAEVDFFEVLIDLRTKRQKTWIFAESTSFRAANWINFRAAPPRVPAHVSNLARFKLVRR
jgi:hypothetical protein